MPKPHKQQQGTTEQAPSPAKSAIRCAPKQPSEKPEVTYSITVVSDHEVKFLEQAIAIYRSNGGCTTPIENFICGLVTNHSVRPMTPKEIRDDMEQELDRDFADAIGIAKKFLAEYPALVCPDAMVEGNKK